MLVIGFMKIIVGSLINLDILNNENKI
jgi:hypothetical protein